MADDPALLEQQLHDLLAAIRKRSTSKVIDQWTMDGDVIVNRLAALRKTTSSGGTIVPPPGASKLGITTQPSSAPTNGTAFAQQPVIQLQDNSSNPVSQAGIVVTVALASGLGTLGGTLTATTDANGVATFTDLVITGLVGARTLAFTATGLTGATSNTVTTVAGAAALISANSATSQDATVSTAVSANPSVLVTDASGNPVQGAAVTPEVTAGGGTVVPASPSTVSTNSSGIATVTSWTVGSGVGTANNTVTMTAAGLTGSPVSFSANGVAAASGDPVAPTQWTEPDPTITGTSRNVSTRAELVSAIAASVRGDEIVLTASFDTTTEITFGTKSGSVSGADGWILVRTDRSASLPATNTRIRPSDAATKLRKIRSTSSDATIRVTGGGWFFRGIEFEVASGATQNFGNVKLGPDNPAVVSDAPDYVVLDRCYVHSETTTNCQRGITVNCQHVAIVDSYVYARSVSNETQAIGGWACPGPTRIYNTTIIGSCENMMWGGADAASAALAPQDIYIGKCYFFAPSNWSTEAHARKNIFELKTAARVLVEDCWFAGNWSQAQSGLAILMTPTNVIGGVNATWGTVKDVHMRRCYLEKSVGGFNLSRQATNTDTVTETLTRVLFEDFLIEDLNSTYTDAGGGDARGIQLLGQGSLGVLDVHFRRVTFNTPQLKTLLIVDDNALAAKPTNFELTDFIGTTKAAVNFPHSYIRNGGGNVFTLSSFVTPTFGDGAHVPNLTSIEEVKPSTFTWETNLANAETAVPGHCDRAAVAAAVSGVNVYEAIGSDV